MIEPQSSPVAGMPPQTNTKKPVWKRWWFGVIIVVVFLAIAGIGSGATNGTAGPYGNGVATIGNHLVP